MIQNRIVPDVLSAPKASKSSPSQTKTTTLVMMKNRFIILSFLERYRPSEGLPVAWAGLFASDGIAFLL